MSKKKLDETWKNCLAMWKWIARKVHNPHHVGVNSLKAEWANNHNFYELYGDCFFCEVVTDGSCNTCPGRKVDPDFDCGNEKYRYDRHPILFYKELVRLNRKRKKK